MHGSSDGIGRGAEVFRGCCRDVVDGHMEVRQGRTSQVSSVPEGGWGVQIKVGQTAAMQSKARGYLSAGPKELAGNTAGRHGGARSGLQTG